MSISTTFVQEIDVLGQHPFKRLARGVYEIGNDDIFIQDPASSETIGLLVKRQDQEAHIAQHLKIIEDVDGPDLDDLIREALNDQEWCEDLEDNTPGKTGLLVLNKFAEITDKSADDLEDLLLSCGVVFKKDLA